MIAGGGTGGHIVPSLQIARALVDAGHAADTIELYGSRRGQEADDAGPRSSSPTRCCRVGGCAAACGPSAWWANAGALLGLAVGLRRAFGSFLARRPRVVVIVGGYASFPAGLAAVLTRVPLVSVNTDAVPGAVNGLLGRFAAANAVAFAGDGPAPGARHRARRCGPSSPRWTGRPAAGLASRAALGLPADRQTVACVGGSLGALRVNRAVAELAGLVGQVRRPCPVPGHRTT